MLQGVALGAVAAMFALAAAGKATSRSSWLALVSTIIGGSSRARVLAITLPAIEIVIAAAVVGWPAGGLPAAAALLVIFGVAVASLSRRLRGVSCNCFGALVPDHIGARLALRNLMLALVCGALSIWLEPRGTMTGVGEAGLWACLLGGSGWVVARARADRRAPGIGSPARIAELEPGRSGLVIMLAPGCAACEALSGELSELSQRVGADVVLPVIASGPPDVRRAMAARIGPDARLDLGELFERWEIMVAPFAVAIGRSGRIVASAPASPDGFARLARALGAEEPRRDASRRRFLTHAVRGAASLLASAGALPFLTSPAWGAGLRLRGPRHSCQNSNVFHGTCSDFANYANQCGLYFDRYGGDNPGHDPTTLGYTHVWPNGTTDVKVNSQQLFERIYNDVTAVCPCPSRTKTYRGPGAAEACDTDRPTGFGCFVGYPCQVGGSVCVMQVYSFTIETPDLKITRLRWVPPKGSSHKCERLAARENADTIAHEMHHQNDARSVIAEENTKYQHWELIGCGPDEESARASLADKLETTISDIQLEAFRAEQTKTEEFDDAEQALGPIRLDCSICAE